MATEISQLAISGADRRDDVLRVELWRTVNSVGNWMAILRNIGGKYNGVFDVQDQFLIDVNGLANTLMQGRVDGDAVTVRSRDLESDWDEYVIIKGVDQAQDLLFHNDFDYAYPDAETAAQQVKTVWNDVINVQLAGLTNITYAAPGGATPAVGSVEFREGTSFLASTQELFGRAGYVFYVDDVLAFQSGAPGFSASGVTLKSIDGDPGNNILDLVDHKERDGDKHYNYVKLYGKNPMFDGYTEYNSPSWAAIPVGNVADDNTTVRVGQYSIVGWNGNPVVTGQPALSYTLPMNNYTAFDFTSGKLGTWALYDNTAGAPGTPGAGAASSPAYLLCVLTDGGGVTAGYYGASSKLYAGEWGYCTYPLGEEGSTKALIIDEWFFTAAFNWANIVDIKFYILSSPGHTIDDPSHLYLDGISMPEPCISVVQNAVAQAAYRRRPYVNYYQHLNTQNALNEAATRVLEQSESTSIGRVSLITEGNLALRYAGQSVTVNIPSLGLNAVVMYMTSIHHIIEPYVDVSGGFGFDWVTEIEAVPTSGVAYDMGRLRDGPMHSSYQTGQYVSTGMRRK